MNENKTVRTDNTDDANQKWKEMTDNTRLSRRGIDTMFRATFRNQIHLSAMADRKANLIISVNSIIISAIIFLIKNIMELSHFILPGIILLIVSVAAIIYAVLATRPIAAKGKFLRHNKSKNNLLFYGNFFKMDLDDYMNEMKMVLQDGEKLYDNLIMEQYRLGKVLGRKYRLLRISYTIFMFGLIFAVLAFVLAVIYHPSA